MFCLIRGISYSYSYSIYLTSGSTSEYTIFTLFMVTQLCGFLVHRASRGTDRQSANPVGPMYSDSNLLSLTAPITRRRSTVNALYKRLNHYRLLMVRSCTFCSKQVLIPPPRFAGHRPVAKQPLRCCYITTSAWRNQQLTWS